MQVTTANTREWGWGWVGTTRNETGRDNRKDKEATARTHGGKGITVREGPEAGGGFTQPSDWTGKTGRADGEVVGGLRTPPVGATGEPVGELWLQGLGILAPLAPGDWGVSLAGEEGVASPQARDGNWIQEQVTS